MDVPSGFTSLASTQEDLEHLGVALAISQQHGGNGVALVVKSTRTKLNKVEAKRTNREFRVDTEMYAAVDQSHNWKGHTALLLLLQEQRVKYGNNPVFYVIGELSEADLGVFVLQVKVDNPRIVCLVNGRIVYYEPTRANRWNVRRVITANVTPALQFTLEMPPITYVQLFALTVPARIRVNLTFRYADLSPRLQGLFDGMFLSLCGALITKNPKADQTSFLQASAIGAVIVNQYGQILSYGVDKGALLHAETVAIKSLQGSLGGSPKLDHCRLYTSLEPCVMCSGFVYEACAKHSQNFKVVYHQWDPAVHKSSFGGEVTGITTVLEEKGIYDRCEESGATIKLKQKMLEMSKLHKHDPSRLEKLFPREKITQLSYQNKFDNSAVEALRILSFRRRFAKLKLSLLAMPAVIDNCGEHQEAKRFLMDVWINILRFLQVDCGQNLAAEMELVALFLDQSRGQNLLRGPSSTKKKESFMEFFQQYAKYIHVFLETD